MKTETWLSIDSKLPLCVMCSTTVDQRVVATYVGYKYKYSAYVCDGCADERIELYISTMKELLKGNEEVYDGNLLCVETTKIVMKKPDVEWLKNYIIDTVGHRIVDYDGLTEPEYPEDKFSVVSNVNDITVVAGGVEFLVIIKKVN